jgi:hypothetical protein
LVDVTVGDSITNSSLSTSKVALVSKPLKNELWPSSVYQILMSVAWECAPLLSYLSLSYHSKTAKHLAFGNFWKPLCLLLVCTKHIEGAFEQELVDVETHWITLRVLAVTMW